MKHSYLDRLAWAARWYLPPAEAREVIDDYQELLAGDQRSQAELVQDLGEPDRAVYMLVRPGAYPRWAVLFLAMAACLGMSTVQHVYLIPTGLGILAMIPRLWALVQARVADRRWRGLYLAAVTVALLCFAVLSVLRDMDVNGLRVFGGWQAPCLYRWMALAAAGALGTGASLC